MEIICSQQQLLGAINTVLKAVSSKTSYPILECILIETDNDDIRLTANDNDFCIETVIPGTVNRAGKIALNARTLADLVRKLPRDEDGNLIYEDKDDVFDSVTDAMKALSDEYPRLEGYYPPDYLCNFGQRVQPHHDRRIF